MKYEMEGYDMKHYERYRVLSTYVSIIYHQLEFFYLGLAASNEGLFRVWKMSTYYDFV